MERIKVTICGVEYPCRPTVGAMVKFEKITGKSFKDFNVNTLTDNCLFLYCCIVSACAVDKVAFDYTFEDFADLMDYDNLQQWAKGLSLSISESVK